MAELYALRLDTPHGDAHWEAALPLFMKGGGGNVSGRNERLVELERDTDPVHVGSASCHHGPPITDTVRVQARSYHTGRELHLELRWEDPTEDRLPLAWEKGGEDWSLGKDDEDGIALIWSRVAGPFGCQEACHMSDFALRGGEVIDLRSMRMAREGEWEEAWVWKAAQGARALVLTDEGFTTAVEGTIFRSLNSAIAADSSLSPEARRAGTFGPGDRPLVDGQERAVSGESLSAPAYLYTGREGGGGLTARAERKGKGWRVVFTRRFDAGEGRQSFHPGERYRLGVALFDGTSTNHHIVRDTQLLEIVLPLAGSPRGGEARDTSEPSGEGQGIL